MYCSSLVTWSSRCVAEAARFRAQLEALMVAAGVDLHLSGHNHQYERSYSVARCDRDYRTECRVSDRTHNPPYPIHIVNGAGGDSEGVEPTWVAAREVPFRAAHSTGFRTGYGRTTINRTHLFWEFIYSGERAIPHLNISTGGTRRVFDKLVLTKDAPPRSPSQARVATNG